MSPQAVRHRRVPPRGRSWRGGPSPSKYGAIPVMVHGRRFASKAEGRRYEELLLLGRAGEVRNLELQPRFTLAAGIVYVADFRYDEWVRMARTDAFTGELYADAVWCDVVEDVKGMKTPVYVLKRKLFMAQHPQITFREIR